MLGWCYLLITPDIERRIYWILQDLYMTHCKNIKRTFGTIFTEFEKRMEGKLVPDVPQNLAPDVPSVAHAIRKRAGMGTSKEGSHRTSAQALNLLVCRARFGVAEWKCDYGSMFQNEAEAKFLLRIFRSVEDADIWN